MSESENRAANWTVGLVGSILLHAAVLGLCVGLGRSHPAAEPESGAVDPAPLPSVVAGEETEAAASPGELPRAVEPVRPGESAEGVTPVVPVAPSLAKVHIVQRGENASKIARKYGLTLQELAKLNDTTIQKLGGIVIGQKLKLAE